MPLVPALRIPLHWAEARPSTWRILPRSCTEPDLIVSTKRSLVWQAMTACLWLALAGPASADAIVHSWHPGNLSRTRCIEGLQRFLPAHVYYCLAIQSYGVHRYASMSHFLDQAALWGSKQAEYVIGFMALNGVHEPVSRSRAMAWYALAAERHTPYFQAAYDRLRGQATASERLQAQAILASLGPKYTDAVAAPRAEERYREGMNWLDAHRGSSHICLSGMIVPRGSTGTPNPAVAGHCPSPGQLLNEVQLSAGAVFEDWGSHVEVKPLQMVRDPALPKGQD